MALLSVSVRTDRVWAWIVMIDTADDRKEDEGWHEVNKISYQRINEDSFYTL